MSEEGALPEVLGEFEVDSPDYGWWKENGNLYGDQFDLSDPNIRLFDYTLLDNEAIIRITQWSQDLRSGRYNQGTEYLFQEYPSGDRCYCCLAIPFLDEEWHPNDEPPRKVYGLEDFIENGRSIRNTLSLPYGHAKQLALFDPVGMMREKPNIGRSLMPVSLANVNDELGWDFKKIGKFITVKLLQAEDEKRNAVQIS